MTERVDLGHYIVYLILQTAQQMSQMDDALMSRPLSWFDGKVDKCMFAIRDWKHAHWLDDTKS